MPDSFARTVATVISRYFPSITFAKHSPSQRDANPEGGPLYPKLFAVLRGGYTALDLSKDIMAGLTVGVVALPLAMAFAISAGLSPIQGLYTAIIAGFVIGIFGGSRFQISGPTGAFVVIIYSIVYRHGYEGLVVTTLLAGLILILAGLFRLGSVIKFIPYPVTTGFTAGIGLTIISSQVGDFFGLPIEKVPPEFIDKWSLYFTELDNTSGVTLGVALSTLILMLLVRRFKPKFPAPVVGVIYGGLLVWLFDLPVATIASRFGDIPNTLPSFHWHGISLEQVSVLLPDAVTIALLAGIESLLTCVVADSMTGDRHYSNMELVAQGLGNLGSALFGGIPATGAIARTATNISAGARSPISALVHSATVLAFVLWLSPLASAIPLASLAAVMLVIAMGMLEGRAMSTILHGPKSDWSVMLLTLVLTVIMDLTVAVYVGVMLASLLFMRRMSAMTSINQVECDPTALDCSRRLELPLVEHSMPEGVHLFTINGPFFFGMVDRFQRAMDATQSKALVYIIYMRNVPTIDATGMHVLESFLAGRSRQGYRVVLTEVPEITEKQLRSMGLIRSLGENNLCPTLDGAVQRAEVLAEKVKQGNRSTPETIVEMKN